MSFFDFDSFVNCLCKMDKYLCKWVCKKNIICYWVYDVDLLSFFLVVDWYEAYFYVVEYKKDYGMDEDFYWLWWAGICWVLSEVLEVFNVNIYYKECKFQKGWE